MWGPKKDNLVTFITVTKSLFKLMICCILRLHRQSLHLHLRILCWEKVCYCSAWYCETNVARSHDAAVCVHVTVGQQYWENVYSCSWHDIVQLCSKPLCFLMCVCVCVCVCRISDCYPIAASCSASADTCCSTSSRETGIRILSCRWQSVNIYIPTFSTADVCSYTRDIHTRCLQVDSVTVATM